MEKDSVESVVTEKKRDFKRMFINFLILFLILTVGLIMYSRYVSTKGLIVKEYRVSSEKIPYNFSGVKIIHFSDVLFKSTVNLDDIKNMVTKMNELKPDIVVFTGGLISEEASLSEEEISELASVLNDIDYTIGKYAVKGDEDGDDFSIIMEDAGFNVLNNEGEFVYNKALTPIFIAGLSSSIKDAIDITSSFEVVDKDSNKDAYYKILLMHEGDSAVSVLKERDDVDLILAGNSLNGSIVIPFYGGVLSTRGSDTYKEPFYEVNNTLIYVSSGLGTKNIYYRFNNKPSFNFYRLKSL